MPTPTSDRMNSTMSTRVHARRLKLTSSAVSASAAAPSPSCQPCPATVAEASISPWLPVAAPMVASAADSPKGASSEPNCAITSRYHMVTLKLAANPITGCRMRLTNT